MKLLFGPHIIQFNGGLGNQMFEYAFYLALKDEMPFLIYGFDISGLVDQHNGFELDRIFHLNTTFQRSICPKLRILERHNYIKFSKLVEKNCWKFEQELLQKKYRPTEYIGFWQTEKYFRNIENKIRKIFKFRTELLNDKTVALANQLSITQNTISMHIRRGDYLGNTNCQTYDGAYYLEAKNLITKHLGRGEQIIIFSDDIEWCREEMQIENAKYVDWNKGIASWQDMYLMSLCKHNIIANSTFSWWGAWLNENPDKIVIAPKVWMKSDFGTDIIPKAWIRI